MTILIVIAMIKYFYSNQMNGKPGQNKKGGKKETYLFAYIFKKEKVETQNLFMLHRKLCEKTHS